MGREEGGLVRMEKEKAYLSASPTRPTSSWSKHNAAVMQNTRAFSGEGAESERRKKRRQQKKKSLCEREGSVEISQLSDTASPVLTDLSLRALSRSLSLLAIIVQLFNLHLIANLGNCTKQERLKQAFITDINTVSYSCEYDIVQMFFPFLSFLPSFQAVLLH